MAKKLLVGFLVLAILSASLYIILPDKVRVDVSNTRTQYSVFENGSLVLGGTEYVNLFDGTKKMRAKNRETSQEVWDGIIRIKRKSLWKDNITTIQTYTFNGSSTDVEHVPVSNEFRCINCVGKIVHYEFRDILYEGITRPAFSPEEFGHNMKVEWQDGYSWAKFFQQKVASDKLIIRYRPDSDDVTYEVRMFDPPPLIQRVDLNSSLGTNLTSQNLTAFRVNVTDADNDSVKNITTWNVDDSGIIYLYWPFEGHSGNTSLTAKDYSDNGNNGSTNGDATYNSTGGRDGFGSYEFFNDGRVEKSAVSPALNLTNTSISVWFNRKSGEVDGVVTSSARTNSHIKHIGFNGADTIKFRFSSTVEGTFDIVGSSVPADEWHHVAVVNNVTHFVMYLDGVFDGQIAAPNNISNTHNLLGVGRSYGAGINQWGHFNGSIDEFQIWDRPLSAEQIAVLAQNRTDLIVSQETVTGEVWQACVTPNDGSVDGLEVCSNNLTVIETTCNCPAVDTNFLIDLAELCVFNTVCDIGTGNLSFVNAGVGNVFTINTTLNVSGFTTLANGEVEGTSNGRLNLKN